MWIVSDFLETKPSAVPFHTPVFRSKWTDETFELGYLIGYLGLTEPIDSGLTFL
jgi:hypothetical protein